MLVIGEKVNIMSKTIGPAMKERDAGPIQEMAVRQVEGGADVLDINLGPATKNGPEMMEFVVSVVQEAVPGTRLCLDTMNPEAMEAGLKVCNEQPIINSTSAERARLETFLPLAKTYEAEIIGLAMTEAGVSRDANERVMAATDDHGGDDGVRRTARPPLPRPAAPADRRGAAAGDGGDRVDRDVQAAQRPAAQDGRGPVEHLQRLPRAGEVAAGRGVSRRC